MKRRNAAPARRRTIFHRLLTGYIAVTLFVVALSCCIGYALMARFYVNRTLAEMLEKAETVAMMVNHAEGRQSFLGPKRLRELEQLSDAEIVYVDTNLQASKTPYDTDDLERLNAKRKKADSTGSTGTTGTTAASGSDGAAFAQSDVVPADGSQPAAADDSDNPPPAFPPPEMVDQIQPNPILTYEAEHSQQEELDLLRINITDSVDEKLMRKILAGEKTVDIRTLNFLNAPVLFAGAPIADAESGEITGAVILCKLYASYSEFAASTFLMMLAGGIVGILFAVLLAYYMSRRIATPIAQLNSVALLIADGQYDQRFTTHSDNEVGQLGDTMNLLAQRLGDVIKNLSDEKSKLEQILAGIGEGILAIDRDGHVVHHNNAALGLLEMSKWELGAEGALTHQAQLIEMLNRSMRDKERIQTSWTNQSGKTIDSVATPMCNYAGETIGAVCLIRDVSEAQRLEQMRRDYIANISHELRTPLTGIRGMVEPLMDGLMETDREREDCYQVIYQETLRLERLIGEMLDLSRLQDGRVQMELEAMAPGALIDGALRRLKERAQKNGIALVRDVSDDTLMVLGNEDRIMQVLIILADNALDFTKPGGSVTLFARKAPGGLIAMGVRDTGSGIEDEDLPYIWERFYKADKSRMRTAGTGLGLAIAKLVVELMHGKIEVETCVGKGSTFTFTLREG